MIYNFTPPTGPAVNVCELDQYAMLEKTQQLPQTLFWFITIALVSLAVALYIVPNLKSEKLKTLLVGLPMFTLGCLVWAWLLALLLTFHPGKEFWDAAVWVVGIVAFVVLGFWIRRVRSDD